MGTFRDHHKRGEVRTLYDLSVILIVGLLAIAAWLYGGDPDEAAKRRQSVVTGVDNFLGGMSEPQLVASYGGIDDDEAVNARMQRIFDRLSPNATELRPDLRYYITVLKSDIPNAFSLPGGRNFITRGLIAILEDDDQVAGVLGHELGHTIKSHGSKGFGRDLGMILLYDFLIDQVDESQREAAAELGNLSYALVSTGYSRAAETEADELGLYLSVSAGFRPLGLAEALENIEKWQKEMAEREGFSSHDVPEFFRTHPLTENRVRHIRQLASEMGYDVYVPGDAVTEATRRLKRQIDAEREQNSVDDDEEEGAVH